MPRTTWLPSARLENSFSLQHNLLSFTHYKCIAHIVDLPVKAAIKELKSSISSVRSDIMAIRSSTKRNEAFHNVQNESIRNGDQKTKCTLQLIEDVDHR